MKRFLTELIPAVLALVSLNAAAVTRYVDLNSAGPTPPYTSWPTAATNIQDAIDAAGAGDLVLVTNGVYATGGRVVSGALTNRVAVDKAITVQSVNGPEETIIRGFQILGNNAVRCVYLADGAILSGFTLTNGATQTSGDFVTQTYGGGIWCQSINASVSNCVITKNTAQYYGGGGYSGTFVNCTFIGNYGGNGGGGTIYGSLTNCLLVNNSAYTWGGGAYHAELDNCTLIGNSASNGGGAGACNLNRCTLLTNSASTGGGAWASTLNGCKLSGNSASTGGGASSCTLNSCALTANWAGTGGGAYNCPLNNCTLMANFATSSGGGVSGGSLWNSIVFYNSAPTGSNYTATSSLSSCCTVPLPGSGSNNINAEPKLADTAHLSMNSPCRGAGSGMATSGTDIDGESWASPPSIGCDEYHPGAIDGALEVSIQTPYTTVPAGFVLTCTGVITGHAGSHYWDFGDGTIVSNLLFASHAWTLPGNYPLVLKVFNETYPDGIETTVAVSVVENSGYHVALTSTNPLSPYLSWATAATNIQDAIDAAVPGATVLVSNGVYQTGGRVVSGALTNRVAVDKAVTVQSVNGPTVTFIQGYQVPGTTNGSSAVRCVYLTSGAALIGFTLTNGATLTTGVTSGGGIWCSSTNSVVSNCVLIGNSAYSAGGGAWSGTLNNCSVVGNSVLAPGTYPGPSAGGPSGAGACASRLNNCILVGNLGFLGGGAHSGTLNNCTIVSNRAALGGGTYGSSLNNCTISHNSATNAGGGAYQSTLNNCVVVSNVATNGTNYSGGSLNYCCTIPRPPSGLGNITNDPMFADFSGGDLRLQSNSACINSGKNAYVTSGTDLNGSNRIVGGTVDIGAYEFQSPSSVLSYAWAQQYGLLTDGSADFTDPDVDGMSNYGEWRSDTIPTNKLSVLRMVNATNSPSGAKVTWQSVSTRSYWLERATNLGAASPFQTIATNVAGVAGTKTFTDTSATNAVQFFYRVGVY